MGQQIKQTITLKLLNGKTGHPVWWRGSAYVFLGNQINQGAKNFEASGKRTNLLGEAKVDISASNAPVMKVWVDFIHRDCRLKTSEAPNLRTFTYDGSTLTALPAYSIQEIQDKGIVSENYCGGPKRAPKPGFLMIYVIPATFHELWNE